MFVPLYKRGEKVRLFPKIDKETQALSFEVCKAEETGRSGSDAWNYETIFEGKRDAVYSWLRIHGFQAVIGSNGFWVCEPKNREVVQEDSLPSKTPIVFSFSQSSVNL